LNAEFDQVMTAAKDGIAALVAEKKRLEDAQDALIDAYLGKQISREALGRKHDPLQVRLEEVNQQIELCSRDYADYRRNMDAYLGLTANPFELYRRSNASVRRLFNQCFFRKLYIDELIPAPEGEDGLNIRADLEDPYTFFFDPKTIERAQAYMVPDADSEEDGPILTPVQLVTRSHMTEKGSRMYESGNVAPRMSNLYSRWSGAVSGWESDGQVGPLKDVRGEVVVQDVQPRTLVGLEHAERLLAEFEAGESIRGLARKHKLHRNTVIRSLRKAGVPPQRPTSITKRPELVTEASRLREEGLTLRKIGEVMGLSRPSVHRLLNA
jgi:lambda repressor-like predicted transcriptional regulator